MSNNISQNVIEQNTELLNKKKSLQNNIYNFVEETLIYFIIELKHIASFAIVATLFSMIIPLGIILMISMMPVQITKEAAVLYISGNFMTSISNMCIVTLAQLLAGIRAKNGFEHFATLPIFTASPMLGTFFSFFLTTLPSLIIMPIVGVLLFKIKFAVSIWLILVIIITMVTMIGIGAVIGTFSDNYEKTQTFTMIAMFFVMFGTPVYYQLEKLPFVIKIFQRLLPFSYSLEAMRSLMVNPSLNTIVIRDIIALLGWMAVSLWAASRLVTWKQKS
ncbi:ABC transporter permease [Clostridium sp. C8-1-8]|uniref:ABC transporter permease n=1 Tax=Clostridium sp. C8-1-8 TaxID=2698831 RepID=UPI0013691867|nr:ABC transporter permease [Clostridium sp. C8-1-8]